MDTQTHQGLITHQIMIRSKERADKLARQIIGVEPLTRSPIPEPPVIPETFDRVSFEKMVVMIKEELCYVKVWHTKIYYEPTLAAVRSRLWNACKTGDIFSEKSSFKARGNGKKMLLVNPQQSIDHFLDHPKYERKSKIKNWRPEQPNAKFSKQNPSLLKRIIRFLKRIFK